MTVALDLKLPGGPRAPAAARNALDGLGDVLDGEMLENLRLLVSELVTNSIRHSGIGRRDRIALKVRVSSRTVLAEVCDPGVGFEGKATVPTEGQTSGWGLFLVEQIADRWGVRGNGGSCVWFEMALPGHAR